MTREDVGGDRREVGGNNVGASTVIANFFSPTLSLQTVALVPYTPPVIPEFCASVIHTLSSQNFALAKYQGSSFIEAGPRLVGRGDKGSVGGNKVTKFSYESISQDHIYKSDHLMVHLTIKYLLMDLQ